MYRDKRTLTDAKFLHAGGEAANDSPQFGVTQGNVGGDDRLVIRVFLGDMGEASRDIHGLSRGHLYPSRKLGSLQHQSLAGFTVRRLVLGSRYGIDPRDAAQTQRQVQFLLGDAAGSIHHIGFPDVFFEYDKDKDLVDGMRFWVKERDGV